MGKPCGQAVLRCKIFAVKSKRNPRLVVEKILKRHIRGVVTTSPIPSIVGSSLLPGLGSITCHTLQRGALASPTATVGGAPDFFTKNTRSVAGCVVDALRLPMCTSVGDS